MNAALRTVRWTCLFAATVLICLAASSAVAQTVFHGTPDWISADHLRGTGGALVDLDRDGWPDFVVANGNDMNRQRVTVYYNRGDGTFPTSPDWQAGDLAYNGHLDVADVDGDGWPDVAVGLLVNEGGPAAKIYMNHQGTLSTMPEWTCDEIANAFGVAFGDMNNDGRPDLAVATGWPYGNPHAFRNTVHLNVGGSLDTAASWQSDDRWDYNNAIWVDADRDGWLDLVGLGANTDTWIYRNLGGVLETSAGWRTTDNSGQFAIMAVSGDVDGDGLDDLFVTDNRQLFNGTGRFRQYTASAQGFYTQTPTWSYYDGYGSAITLADVNDDGLLDLATGAWWDYTRLFFNNGTGFNASPSWSSTGTSVVEKIIFADLDRSALRRTTETFTPEAGPRLFHLAHQPIETVLTVTLDGVQLDPNQYTFNREHGWITVASAPADALDVEYVYARSLDMAITNWDSSRGNYIYYNLMVVNGDADGDRDVDLDDYTVLFDCLTGPDGTWSQDACADFDQDVDGDIDLADAAAFARAFTGP